MSLARACSLRINDDSQATEDQYSSLTAPVPQCLCGCGWLLCGRWLLLTNTKPCRLPSRGGAKCTGIRGTKPKRRHTHQEEPLPGRRREGRNGRDHGPRAAQSSILAPGGRYRLGCKQPQGEDVPRAFSEAVCCLSKVSGQRSVGNTGLQRNMGPAADLLGAFTTVL